MGIGECLASAETQETSDHASGSSRVGSRVDHRAGHVADQRLSAFRHGDWQQPRGVRVPLGGVHEAGDSRAKSNHAGHVRGLLVAADGVFLKGASKAELAEQRARVDPQRDVFTANREAVATRPVELLDARDTSGIGGWGDEHQRIECEDNWFRAEPLAVQTLGVERRCRQKDVGRCAVLDLEGERVGPRERVGVAGRNRWHDFGQRRRGIDRRGASARRERAAEGDARGKQG